MFEKQFELRYFEMNKHGEASPTTILTLLEETASDHCNSINHGLFDLIKQNIGWVLVSGATEIYRYPAYREKIVIRTWLSKYTLVKGIRENIIFDEQGAVIGRSKGQWVFFDVCRKRPVQIFEDIKERWSFYEDESIHYDIFTKLRPLDTAQYMMEFPIHRFDIDMNLHVSNLKYLQWALETIPDETMENCYLHSIDGRFIGEANLGDTVVSYTQPDILANHFTHTIKIKDNNQVCAVAKTIWKDRGRS
ncbi:MAG: acyl-[acyl-carrier-protein] thioesterase [Bacteroidales bacterium]